MRRSFRRGRWIGISYFFLSQTDTTLAAKHLGAEVIVMCWFDSRGESEPTWDVNRGGGKWQTGRRKGDRSICCEGRNGDRSEWQEVKRNVRC